MTVDRPRLLVSMIATSATRALEIVVRRIPPSLAGRYDVEILVIEDGPPVGTLGSGETLEQSAGLPFEVTALHNPVDQGYGGNRKIALHYAIANGFDFVALLHGEGRHPPETLEDLTEPLRLGEADAVLGSRPMRPGAAIEEGRSWHRYLGSRLLTAVQNRLLGTKLSELHSGYRAYSVAALKGLPFDRNSNSLHFDTEILIQLIVSGGRIREIPIPACDGGEISWVDGMKFARNVVKVSLQARLQSINLFYDRRFDCAPDDAGRRYPAKLDFPSSHSRVLELVPEGSRVLDLGSGTGVVGAALAERKACRVVGCDIERGDLTGAFDRFFPHDLDGGVPELQGERFEYILALDVIEHLDRPEDFLDQLRALSSRTGAQVILTTANVGFILMRLLLLLGRFEYGKRGILDLTHKRLFTRNTLRRAVTAAGFEVKSTEGVVVPVPFVLGYGRLSRLLLEVNRLLARLRPTLFGFQLLVVLEPRPTLETLLRQAVRSPGATASRGA
jgi:2-polyprenyl-3-methyl-5-hydroxy-6-metoxy-1,4-benzoquinol methylase